MNLNMNYFFHNLKKNWNVINLKKIYEIFNNVLHTWPHCICINRDFLLKKKNKKMQEKNNKII